MTNQTTMNAAQIVLHNMEYEARNGYDTTKKFLAPSLKERERAHGELKRLFSDQGTLAARITSHKKTIASIEAALCDSAVPAAFGDAAALKQMAALRSSETHARQELADLELAHSLLVKQINEADRAFYLASKRHTEMCRIIGRSS